MFEQFLLELANDGHFKVAGSYARGEQTSNSDIDFQVATPSECIMYSDRINTNILFLKQLLKKYNIKWNSTRNDYISTIGEQNAIPVPLEFYTDFHRNKNRIKEGVIISGVIFKTH